MFGLFHLLNNKSKLSVMKTQKSLFSSGPGSPYVDMVETNLKAYALWPNSAIIIIMKTEML